MVILYNCNIWSHGDVEIGKFMDLEFAEKKALELIEYIEPFERLEIKINGLLYKKFDGNN